MTARLLPMLLAATITSAPALAQTWQGQSGVAPSYLQPAPKVTLRVASQGALDAALIRAKGGEVIGLAPGPYSVDLRNRPFPATVTLTSADPSKPATLKSIKFSSVSNFTFSQLIIARTLMPGEPTEGNYIGKVEGGRDITFDAVYIHGSLDKEPSNDLIGLNVGGVKNARVINSEFQQLGRGAQFGALSGAVIANNKVHEMRSDGFDFAQSDNVLIDGNHFSNTKRIKTDHPDGIQFWTTRTTRPSTDITIRNNQILQGDGDGTQGIFMRDEQETLPYQRITIENNLMVGSNMANGIVIMHGKDVNILNNTILSRTDDSNPVWIRMTKVENLKLEGNIAEVGGNRTPQRAGIDMSLLGPDRFRTIKPEDVIVPGIGFQLKQ
jgi:hypothetical protein